MTTTLHAPAVKPPTTVLRKTAFIAGALYLLTFVTSIPTLGLYGPVKKLDFITGTGSDVGVRLGAFMEVILALAGVGTALVLYPVVKRQNERLALSFVASRLLEASMIV